MKTLLKFMKILLIFFLCLIIVPRVYYYIFAYKGLIFSFGAKKALKGKIVYSLSTLSDIDIRIIDFHFMRKASIYKTIPRGEDGFPGYIPSFAFSQDGSKIVFSKMGDITENHRFKLYTMNVDGSDVKELLYLEGLNLKHPSWSPDGKKVSFIVQKPYDQGSLYITDVDKPYSSLKVISNIRPALYKPMWSPDGQKISFTSDEYIVKSIRSGWRSETFNGRTFIINSDRTGLRQSKAKRPVSWSPDGSLLLYRGEDGYYISNENETQSYLLIPYKRAPISLLVGDPSFAVWSPDGKYIAYVKEHWPGGAGLGIYVVSLDNPAKEIQISAEIYGINEMVWLK